MLSKHYVRRAFAAPIFAGLISFATAAAAEPLNFTYTALSGPSFTFTADRSPTPAFSDSARFRLTNVNITYGGTAYVDLIDFYLAGIGGGMDDVDGSGLFQLIGPQLFTGTTAAPTFTTGSFNLASPEASNVPVGTLTIAAAAAVPEPATWAMMLLGFLGVGLAIRRSRSPLQGLPRPSASR